MQRKQTSVDDKILEEIRSYKNIIKDDCENLVPKHQAWAEKKISRLTTYIVESLEEDQEVRKHQVRARHETKELSKEATALVKAIDKIMKDNVNHTTENRFFYRDVLQNLHKCMISPAHTNIDSLKELANRYEEYKSGKGCGLFKHRQSPVSEMFKVVSRLESIMRLCGEPLRSNSNLNLKGA
jgi:hypothetical protein